MAPISSDKSRCSIAVRIIFKSGSKTQKSPRHRLLEECFQVIPQPQPQNIKRHLLTRRNRTNRALPPRPSADAGCANTPPAHPPSSPPPSAIHSLISRTVNPLLQRINRLRQQRVRRPQRRKVPYQHTISRQNKSFRTVGDVSGSRGHGIHACHRQFGHIPSSCLNSGARPDVYIYRT